MHIRRMHIRLSILSILLLSSFFLIASVPLAHSDSCSGYGSCQSCLQAHCAWCSTDSRCTSEWFSCDTGALVTTADPTQCPGSTTVYTTTVESTTISYTTTINSSTTIQSGPCQPGEVLGGLPSGPVCYEPGVRTLQSGDASVVDLSGNPSSNFTVNMAVVTGSGRVWQTDPQFVVQVDQYSSAALLGLSGSPTSGYYLSQEADSYISSDQQGQAMLQSINEALDKASEIYKSDNPFSRGVATLKSMMLYKKGTIELAGSDLKNFGFGVAQLMGIATKTDGDPAFMVNASNEGTAISVANGTVLVFNLALNSTLDYVILQAGQQLFIPNNRTLAAQEDLNASIVPFQIATTTTVPASTTTVPSSSSIKGEMATVDLVFMLILLAIIFLLYRRRHATVQEKGKSEEFSDKNLDRLTKLDGLLKSRAITRQEYNEQKDRIMGKVRKPHSAWNTIALVTCILLFILTWLYFVSM